MHASLLVHRLVRRLVHRLVLDTGLLRLGWTDHRVFYGGNEVGEEVNSQPSRPLDKTPFVWQEGCTWFRDRWRLTGLLVNARLVAPNRFRRDRSSHLGLIAVVGGDRFGWRCFNGRRRWGWWLEQVLRQRLGHQKLKLWNARVCGRKKNEMHQLPKNFEEIGNIRPLLAFPRSQTPPFQRVATPQMGNAQTERSQTYSHPDKASAAGKENNYNAWHCHPMPSRLTGESNDSHASVGPSLVPSWQQSCGNRLHAPVSRTKPVSQTFFRMICHEVKERAQVPTLVLNVGVVAVHITAGVGCSLAAGVAGKFEAAASCRRRKAATCKDARVERAQRTPQVQGVQVNHRDIH